jgi:thymidine phosphorylase
MKPGFFFYIVGPSCAGKDSLIDGARKELPSKDFIFAKRVITRPPGKPGEDYNSCTESQFQSLDADGAFLVTWTAHGLMYGLRRDLVAEQQTGKHIIANGSRAIAEQLKALVPNLVFIEITAPTDVLAKRIAQRGRETEQEIRDRLTRQVDPLPVDVETFQIQNDQSLAIGIRRFVSILSHVTGLSDAKHKAHHKKLSGKSLTQTEIRDVFGLINSGELDTEDVNAILIEYCRHLSGDELITIAQVRSELMPRIEWPASIVVDKHSLGGTPGSRVTMVVIPIVAEHGLLIPKTSSRAITSAAGTADAMEVLAKVDLNREEVRNVAIKANGCIAWNGRLNHSRLDDSMNAITRPLSLDTRRWSVASILSKKYSAGATHVVIDIPYSPTGKVKSEQEATDLGALFETVGHAMGMTVKAFGTPGHAPIGRGIGAGLEACDVLLTLSGDPKAPADLLEKALFFAGHILAFDSEVGNYETGRARAEELLVSNRALDRLKKIIELQGAATPLDWTRAHTKTIVSGQSGTVVNVDGHRISGIARQAGAPDDKLAGVYLHANVGTRVLKGTPLFDVYASRTASLEDAIELANTGNGFEIT